MNTCRIMRAVPPIFGSMKERTRAGYLEIHLLGIDAYVLVEIVGTMPTYRRMDFVTIFSMN